MCVCVCLCVYLRVYECHIYVCVWVFMFTCVHSNGARYLINCSLLYEYNIPMQMPNNVVPVCMLYVAADHVHGLVTSLPFVRCTCSKYIKNYSLLATI